MIELSEHGGAFGGGGKGASVNLFVQPDEPRKKDGIWIKADKKFDEILMTDEIYDVDNGVFEELAKPPYTSINESRTGIVKVAKEIHVLSEKNHYSYSIETDTWQQLSEMPFTFTSSSSEATAVVNFKDSIFVFAPLGERKSVYKYDTELKTWEQLKVANRNFHGSIPLIYDDYIYLIGGSSEEHSLTTKFNPEKQEFNNIITDGPDYHSSKASTLKYIDRALVVGGSSASYMLNFTTDKWERIDRKALPTASNNKLTSLNHHGFSIGLEYRLRWFNIFTDEKSNELAVIPSEEETYLSAHCECIYCVSENYLYKYEILKKFEIEQNTAVMLRRGKLADLFKTEIVTPTIEIKGNATDLKSDFTIAQLYHDGKLHQYPVYYGTGTEWLPVPLENI